MAGLAAHDAMSRFHSRQSGGASGAGGLISVGERLQHLAFDLDVLLRQSDLLELSREPRDAGTLRRGLAVRPALAPPLQPRIFARCAPLEPLTNSQDTRRLGVDCSRSGLSRTLSSFVVVRPACQPTGICLAFTLHAAGIAGETDAVRGSACRGVRTVAPIAL